ncbi:MAG: DnaJ domain-containing protein [Desulfoplanes sp.]|nr:DnaJ domain-containing protein [Desulfoplanes sp.]
MDLRQSYTILGLRFGADLETVKSAFRKQAFDSHPDLHPDDAHAAKAFHDLNEAYVYLRKYLSAKEAKAQETQKAKPRPRTAQQFSGAQTTAQQPSRPEKPRTQTTETIKPQTGHKNFAAKQEEVLKDLLDDPFARQVFEDIFEKIKTHRPQTPAAQNQAPAKKRTLNLPWDKRSLNPDLSEGFFAGIKKWAGAQMDEYQTIRLPARQLLPGSMVRVQIKRRGKETQSLDIRLPHTFVVGRPIRIKGQGRKLGPLKGDLYLRFLAV